MAYSRIGTISAGSASSNAVTTGALNTTGATLLVLILSDFQSVALSAISDSKGNTWTPLTSHAVTGGPRCTMFYSFPTSVGSGHTFTATRTGAFMSIAVGAYSGVGPAFSLQSGATGNVSSLAPGSLTPPVSNALVIVGSVEGSGSVTVLSIGDGLTIREDHALNAGGGTDYGVMFADLIETSIASKNPLVTFQGSGNVGVVMGVFTLAGSPGPPGTRWRPNTLNITETIGQNEICAMEIEDRHGSQFFQVNDTFSLDDGLITIFKGDIEETILTTLESPYSIDATGVNIHSPVGARIWALRAAGLTNLSRRVLTGAFSAQARIPISTVVGVMAGIIGVASDIIATPTLPDVFLSEQETVADALTRLSDLATSLSGSLHVWKIGYPLNVPTLIFKPVTSMAAGSSIGTGGYPARAGSIRYRVTREQFANSVVLKLDRYLKDGGGTQTDTKLGSDIFLGTLTLAAPVASEPKVTLNGADQTVGVKDVDTGMDWYWSLGSSVLIVGGSAAGGSDVILVTYAAHDLRAVVSTNSGSVAAVGLFQVPILSSDSGNVASPLTQATAELKRRDSLIEHLTLQVRCPSGTFSHGQLIAVSLTGLGSTGVTSLTGNFYCQSIRTFDEDLVLWRELELMRGPLLYRGAAFLRRLTR